MKITLRRYRLLSDFERVSQFMRLNFKKYQLGGNVPQPFWEYAHTHPYFNHSLTHRFGIWEENEEVVGVACYEMDVGECYFSTKEGYDFLKHEMVEYAETELSKRSADQYSLDIRVYDYEEYLIKSLVQKGYHKVYSEPIRVYNYVSGFSTRTLPEGFTFITLENENDLRKINDVLWRGFNHGDEPDDDLDSRLLMQSGPHFRKDLTAIIKAPNGEYACFAGMWVDGVNDFAYLEPLATDPRYRSLGLATVAVTELMKRTEPLGATYCFGGAPDFYPKIGFETACHREMWSKAW
ncbi:GNAT family N-acetyltransferase [Paenibacillus sp. FSL L8-0470]|uniref:GNAT family N-acetyltransferase n=1 Tax=Paenibacillus sp. FSL L8-0470 TaxID=2954688 RepID=UPI0030FBE529